MGNIFILSGWWFQTWLDDFRFHIWDVIRQPLTNSIIFQDGHIAPPTSHPKWLDLHHIHPNLVTVMAMAGSPAAELTHPSFFGMG